ncbi:MAG: response regulator [Anaerolineae bacterium]|jgi:CheY-like chemotaxis protein|nr:response regulator [Anaerolineae bacterium]
MRILYVEDNPANLFLVKRVAKMGGHEVINYIDGEDALANFDKDRPDLVLMDIQLAGELTGLQVVQRLREQGHRTPIIAVTAYAMLGDRERFLAAGCDDYIAKPLPIPRLVELLDHYSRPPTLPVLPEAQKTLEIVRFQDTSTDSATTAVDETREVPQVVVTPTPTPTPPLPTPVPSDPAATTHRVPPPITPTPPVVDPVPEPTPPDPVPVVDTESKTREVIVPVSVLAPVNTDSPPEKPLERFEGDSEEDDDTALLRPPSGNDSE